MEFRGGGEDGERGHRDGGGGRKEGREEGGARGKGERGGEPAMGGNRMAIRPRKISLVHIFAVCCVFFFFFWVDDVIAARTGIGVCGRRIGMEMDGRCLVRFCSGCLVRIEGGVDEEMR